MMDADKPIPYIRYVCDTDQSVYFDVSATNDMHWEFATIVSK